MAWKRAGASISRSMINFQTFLLSDFTCTFVLQFQPLHISKLNHWRAQHALQATPPNTWCVLGTLRVTAVRVQGRTSLWMTPLLETSLSHCACGLQVSASQYSTATSMASSITRLSCDPSTCPAWAAHARTSTHADHLELIGFNTGKLAGPHSVLIKPQRAGKHHVKLLSAHLSKSHGRCLHERPHEDARMPSPCRNAEATQPEEAP
jgi:hypothetical protein